MCDYSWRIAFSLLYHIYHEIESYSILPQILQTSYIHLVNVTVHPSLHFLDQTLILIVTKSVFELSWAEQACTDHLSGAGCCGQGCTPEWKKASCVCTAHTPGGAQRHNQDTRGTQPTLIPCGGWFGARKEHFYCLRWRPPNSLFHELRKKDNGRSREKGRGRQRGLEIRA